MLSWDERRFGFQAVSEVLVVRLLTCLRDQVRVQMLLCITHASPTSQEFYVRRSPITGIEPGRCLYLEAPLTDLLQKGGTRPLSDHSHNQIYSLTLSFPEQKQRCARTNSRGYDHNVPAAILAESAASALMLALRAGTIFLTSSATILPK